MTGNIALIAMSITWISIFLYVSLTFGTPIIAGLLGLAGQILVSLLILLVSEALRL